MKKMKIIITAGGTGGHILPGISIYEQLTMDEHEIKFICRKQDYILIDNLKKIKKDLIFFQGIGLQRKLNYKNVIFIYYLIWNSIRALFLFWQFAPDSVIAMGGYITFPVLFISRLLNVPFFLCEQNSIPGIVNRIFKKSAAKIFLNYKYSEKYLNTNNYFLAGNPLREEIKIKIDRKKAVKFFKFKESRKVLLIMGGSQGAVK